MLPKAPALEAKTATLEVLDNAGKKALLSTKALLLAVTAKLLAKTATLDVLA